MARNYVALLHVYLKEMDCLSDAEFGRLCRALLKYSVDGTPIALNGNERFFANRVTMQEDEFKAAYENGVRQKSEAGKASADKRRSTPLNTVEQKPTEVNETDNIIQDNIKQNNTPNPNGLESNRRFHPPTREEVRAYCQERQNRVDADKWYDYYSSNGWRVGKNQMKDWKAAVRTWERNEFSKPQSKNVQPSMNYGEADRNELEAMRRMLNKGVGA